MKQSGLLFILPTPPSPPLETAGWLWRKILGRRISVLGRTCVPNQCSSIQLHPLGGDVHRSCHHATMPPCHHAIMFYGTQTCMRKVTRASCHRRQILRLRGCTTPGIPSRVCLLSRLSLLLTCVIDSCVEIEDVSFI